MNSHLLFTLYSAKQLELREISVLSSSSSHPCKLQSSNLPHFSGFSMLCFWICFQLCFWVSSALFLGFFLALFLGFFSSVSGPTFRRIIKNKSTEQFSGLPYVYSLLNCLICCWYGLPFVSPDVVLVATTNSFGAIFQFVYLAIFIVYADQTSKMKMCSLLGVVLASFAAIAYISLTFMDSQIRQLFIGYLSVFSLISMFASPLFIINLVIKSRSVEYMPFFLSFATFLMSLSFSAYGLLKGDVFIYAPNGIGTILGLVQLGLYYYYSSQFDESSREPLLQVYA
ncbi:Bidirectional sugar transporter SWEET2a [Linum perenne]